MSNMRYDDPERVKLFKEQRRAVSTLGLHPLESWLRAEDFLLETIQEKLANSPHVMIREALARHKSTVKRIQEQLSQDKHARVREALAQSSALDAEVAENLLATKQTSVWLQLAANSNTPQSVKAELLKTKDARVINKLARRSDLSEEEFKQLHLRVSEAWRSQGAHSGIYTILAASPSIKRWYAEEIIRAESRLGMRYLVANPELALDLVEAILAKESAFIEDLAKRSDLTPKMLQSLVDRVDSGAGARNLLLRQELTRNQVSSLYERFGSQQTFRLPLADHPKAPVEFLLGALEGRYGFMVYDAALSNPQMSHEKMMEVAEKGKLKELSSLALNPSLPRDVQLKVAQRGGWSVWQRLRSNQAYVPDADFPLGILLQEQNQTRTFEIIKAASIPKDVWDTLAASWRGSLNELKVVAESFQTE